MRLRALRLHNVKRFAGQGVAIENIGDGVNVFTAANEYGKSTCFEALHALFFQPHSGTPSAVQMLRPYSGGNPLIEVDIETEEGRFRLTKQYYSGRNARVLDLASHRLVAQADEAEKFISDLTRGGAGGPAGLLWLRQGVTGLEKRSKSEEESERRVRETLLSSVQGEVETLTGGRRMAEITAACEEALSRLVTATLRPKTGGPYAEALEERDRLRAQESQLAEDVNRLRDALERRRAIVRHLAELEAPEEVAERKAAITRAEAAYQAARSHADILNAAEKDHALALEQLRSLTSEQERYEAAFARALVLEQQRKRIQQEIDAANALHAQALSDRATKDAEALAAEAAERRAREDKDRFEAAQRARDAADRYLSAKQKLDEAERLRAQIETLEAQRAVLVVPTKTVEEIEKLDVDLARLRLIQSASLPAVQMVYADPNNDAVTLAGTPLAHEVEKTFSGTIELAIGSLGRLIVRSQHVDNHAEAVEKLETKLRTQLSSIGVESVAALLERQRAAKEKSDALALAQQLLTQLAPDGIDALREQVAGLDALRSDALEVKFDPRQLHEALQAAEAAVVATRASAREARSVAEASYKDLVDAQAKLVGLEAELRTQDAILGAVETREATRHGLSERVAIARQRVEDAAATLEPLRATAADLAAAEVTLQRLRSVAQAADQSILQYRSELGDLNGQIRTQADKAVEENWLETRDRLAAAELRVARYEKEIKTLDRLRKALASARSAARDLYLKPVITELRPLIGLLFDDVTVSFNEDTLLPETVLRNGQEEDVERLSGGMREQLSVLTRLAFARLLARNGRAAPVILDDALVYSDDERIERMFEALHRQAQDQQLIVFSCRQRAFSRLGGNVLAMTPWQA